MNQDFYNEFALRYEVGFDSLNVYVDTKKSPLNKGPSYQIWKILKD